MGETYREREMPAARRVEQYMVELDAQIGGRHYTIEILTNQPYPREARAQRDFLRRNGLLTWDQLVENLRKNNPRMTVRDDLGRIEKNELANDINSELAGQQASKRNENVGYTNPRVSRVTE